MKLKCYTKKLKKPKDKKPVKGNRTRDVNLVISVVTLNVNGLSNLIKR